MQKKMIIFNVTPPNTDISNLVEFEKKVARVAKLGATHILISEIPKSRWMWDQDRSDPYPNWGMLISALFKIIVPDELKEWLPLDYAENNFKLIKNRMEILRKYNLKAAASFCEPFYLPEEVYRTHPQWRGPRCDHPRRAKNYYYSPCMDNEEVLDMYRKTMQKLCSEIDIDYMHMYTNDSGAGICWSSGLYSGANGPELCKSIPISQRILSYFKVFRQGAMDAGRDIYIETNSNIGIKENEHAMDDVWKVMEDGMAVNSKNNKCQPMSSLVDVNYIYTLAPVRNIPLVVTFLELLEKAYIDCSEIVKITILDDDWEVYCKIVEAFNKKHTKGLYDRVALLREVALDIAGESDCDALLDAWDQIEIGLKHYLDTYTEGLVWCSVNQRLINRPFVLFPDELTTEEKVYYRPFQFQANDEKHANDLLDNQCTSFIRGYYAIFIATRTLKRAMSNFGKAEKAMRLLAASSLEKVFTEKMELSADRLKLLNYFLQNYIHAIEFQDIVDTTDYNKEPEISSKWPITAEPKLLKYQTITRAEIDNTCNIISLIEGRERDMLVLAPTHELEDIFWLSPKLVLQLKTKVNIMLDHQLDGKRLFVTNNK